MSIPPQDYNILSYFLIFLKYYIIYILKYGGENDKFFRNNFLTNRCIIVYNYTK